MPIRKSEYHPKWTLISRLIRLHRANNRCEECGLQNGRIIKRLKGGDFRTPSAAEWDVYHSKLRNQYNKVQALKVAGLTKVVLTVAHLDQDRNNNRFSNLKALCQCCHLKIDKGQHIANRKYGRHWKMNQIKLDI
jgi:hypothetical protein